MRYFLVNLIIKDYLVFSAMSLLDLYLKYAPAIRSTKSRNKSPAKNPMINITSVFCG